MANVLNKLIKGENEMKTPQNGTNLDKRAYSNMMLYLKEMKLHNVKNLDLAEQIFHLSESSVEKLNEMHEVLTEKIISAPDQAETEELLQSTEHLQEQIGNLTKMLKEMYERQEVSGERVTVPVPASAEAADWKELVESWKQFESQMNQRFENHSSQVVGAVGNAELDIADHMEEIKKNNEQVQENIRCAVQDMQMDLTGARTVMDDVRTGIDQVGLVTDDMRAAVADVRHAIDDVKTSFGDAIDDMKSAIDDVEMSVGHAIHEVKTSFDHAGQDKEKEQEAQPVIPKEELEELVHNAVRDAVEERLANQNTVVASVIQSETKRTLEEGTSAQRATIEAVIQNEMNRMVNEGNESQRAVISEAVHQEMQAMAAEGVFDQRESIGSVIQSEMNGFRGGLTEAVGDEIAEYNQNVKKMTDKSQQVFEESLENHERIIKKEISLVQEMLENAMEDQLESTIQQLESTKKVMKGYARAAMWTSCLALIILFIDILILR